MIDPLPTGHPVYVLSLPGSPTVDQIEQAIRSAKQFIAEAMPGAKVIVLTDGQTLTGIPAIGCLERIESKLDRLIEALDADGEEEDQPAFTLDGTEMPEQRDQSQPL